MRDGADLTGGGAGIRTYANRGGRMSPGRSRTIERLMPEHGLDAETDPEWDSVFPGCRQLHAEIGCGAGEAALDYCRANPNHALVAFEVYPVGVAALLAAIESEGMGNLKVAWGDALQLMPRWFGEGSLDGLRAFYPDPWPKKRHHKRRLVNRGFLRLAGRLLSRGGVLHLATDWPDYAEQILASLAEEPGWELIAHGDGSAARAGRPVTRFERRAIREGRRPWDCRARRA